jgi:hypothetical protein
LIGFEPQFIFGSDKEELGNGIFSLVGLQLAPSIERVSVGQLSVIRLR